MTALSRAKRAELLVGVSDDGVLSWPSLETEFDRLHAREQLLTILFDAR